VQCPEEVSRRQDPYFVELAGAWAHIDADEALDLRARLGRQSAGLAVADVQ
jgi:hypothetical protein